MDLEKKFYLVEVTLFTKFINYIHVQHVSSHGE